MLSLTLKIVLISMISSSTVSILPDQIASLELSSIHKNTTSYSDGDCPRAYPIFSAFRKVIDTPKYACYGKPSAYYKRYNCPNKALGTCQGNYVKQEFCSKGKKTFLYHTNTRCTCGCVDKNFHGRSLDILDLSPCGCEDDLEEIIGVDDF